MLGKTAALSLCLIGLLSVPAFGQRNKPLFLDARNSDDPAVIDVTEITEQYPKMAVEEYQKGVAEARKGNRTAAREHLEAAIRIEPRFFNAHNSLAILFHRTAQYEDAEREYREAGKLNPRSPAPMVNLASLLVEQAMKISTNNNRAARSKLNEALASVNRAFEIQPGAPFAYYWTGVVYYLTGFFEEAETNFKKALASGDPRLVPAHLALADIYVRIQEWDNVVVQVDEYLDDVPFASNRMNLRAVRSAALEKLQPTNQ